MNPSSSGWIKKFGHLVKDYDGLYDNFEALYLHLKSTGFIYGINIKIPEFIHPEHPLSEDEKAKINLLAALYFTYKQKEKFAEFSQFLDKIFEFYNHLGVNKISFLHKILNGKKTSTQLEKLIDSRIYIDDNVISKTFNSIITNSLLFIDVLTFKKYLESESDLKKYAEKLEYITINSIHHALNSKQKNRNDEKLAQLFESSLTYLDNTDGGFDGAYRAKLKGYFTHFEKLYFLDVSCLTVWEDQSVDHKESEFIFSLGYELELPTNIIVKSLENVSHFFDKNAEIIPHLKSNNLAVQFYDSMSKIVNKLILRNSKRLSKELSESKELVALLSKSATKELTEVEKKKVQNQLLDIFKSIPSLAIFILPGGAVLLPIFIKLIPKLLPSSFDENRVE